MNIYQSVREVLRKYADFSGTAARPEFWWFALFAAVVHLALNSLNIYTDQGTVYLGASLSGAFGVAILVPSLAVAVRRLRDVGRTWRQLFWLLLPVIGLIILIVRLAEPGREPSSAAPPATPTTPAAVV